MTKLKIDGYSNIELLGAGAIGAVFKAINKQGDEVAVKLIYGDPKKYNQLEDLAIEAENFNKIQKDSYRYHLATARSLEANVDIDMHLKNGEHIMVSGDKVTIMEMPLINGRTYQEIIDGDDQLLESYRKEYKKYEMMYYHNPWEVPDAQFSKPKEFVLPDLHSGNIMFSDSGTAVLIDTGVIKERSDAYRENEPTHEDKLKKAANGYSKAILNGNHTILKKPFTMVFNKEFEDKFTKKNIYKNVLPGIEEEKIEKTLIIDRKIPEYPFDEVKTEFSGYKMRKKCNQDTMVKGHKRHIAQLSFSNAIKEEAKTLDNHSAQL
ncbi:hypothetical protein [Cysteiniphilum sp. JM-1]|uniref:hypothetical protein n=1 Tax=Cysteiniphilum sp. JM-1 TaxID=2610891 RepID=UPI0012443403|nr:hypothetical protein [Cysteiniphilum sp. JM-1]